MKELEPTGETGKYSWEAAKERVVNDYKDLDFEPTQNDGFRDETEREEHMLERMKLEEIELDSIPW